MRPRSWLGSALIVAALLGAYCPAQEAVQWQPTLETAKRLAGQTNRLVLVHFWAHWCDPCRRMDRDVFSQREVGTAIAASFVPVKVHADQFPKTMQQYGVTSIPTDVILTPQGQMVAKLAGPTEAADYISRLDRVAADHRSRMSELYAQMRPGTAGASSDQPLQSGAARPPYGEIATGGPQTPAGQVPDWREAALVPQDGRSAAAARPPYGQISPPAPRYGDRAMAGPAQPAEPAAEPPTPDSPRVAMLSRQMPPGSPPLGLEGYCPVSVTEQNAWKPGDLRFGAIHRGRTYLCANAEERQKFLANGDRYAPVLSGYDVVIAVDEGRMVPGVRDVGVWYPDKGPIYLFSSEANLDKFSANPERYARAAQEIIRQAALQGHQDPAQLNRPPQSAPALGGRPSWQR